MSAADGRQSIAEVVRASSRGSVERVGRVGQVGRVGRVGRVEEKVERSRERRSKGIGMAVGVGGAGGSYRRVEGAAEQLKEGDEIPGSHGLGVRHVQSLLVFMCLVVLYMVKAHLGVTIVAMTTNSTDTIACHGAWNNRTDEKNFNSSTSREQDESGNSTGSFGGGACDTADEQNPWTGYKTYDWSKPTQELVLNSFYFGYVLMAFPMGPVCQRWGGKRPLQVALLVSGLSSIPMPWLTLWGGWQAVCWCRALQGLTQAGMMPAIHTLLARWVPASERARLVCYVYTGSSVGAVVAFQLGGVLAAGCGWPATFWVTGALCLLVFVVFSVFGAATPAGHKYISTEEKLFIVGHVDAGARKKRRTPWREMATSKHVWGVFISHMGGFVSNMYCFIQVPSYVYHVLGVNIRNSGILSSIPYISTCIASTGFGALSDFLTNRRILTVRTTRRMFNSISEFGFAACIVLVAFTTQVPLAIFLFVLSLTLHAAMHAGGFLTYIDIAPHYSGVLMAAGNTLANLLLLTMPLFVSHIVTDMSDQAQWRTMFYIVAAIATLGNLGYLLLMSADVQPWNDGQHPVDDDEDLTENLQEDPNK